MDSSLRCNSLKCRTQLNDRAVVTTCSHIFCVSCTESFGLANSNGSARVCPACETHLANPDDAVVTQLNPAEDYKTSVLSGLSPSIIMECAGRGLSFYSYQTTQEIIYQEFLARSLTEKYSTLSSQMDKIINDANSEIISLRDKLSAMHAEQKNLEQKNQDLAEAFRQKAKHQQQLQKLYQNLKQQQVASGMEMAAQYNAEHVIHVATNKHHSNRAGGVSMHNHTGSNGSGSGPRRQLNCAWQKQPQDSRVGLQSSRSAPGPATPSDHRTRLPVPLNGNRATAMGNNETLRQDTPYRPALVSIDPNVYGNNNSANHGMSAGMKVGRQQQGPIGRPSGIGGLDIR